MLKILRLCFFVDTVYKAEWYGIVEFNVPLDTL